MYKTWHTFFFIIVCVVSAGCVPHSTNVGVSQFADPDVIESQDNHYEKEQDQRCEMTYKAIFKVLLLEQDYQGALDMMPQVAQEMLEEELLEKETFEKGMLERDPAGYALRTSIVTYCFLDELTQVQQVCAEVFQAMADGISPPGYFPGLFDAVVSGVALSFQLPDRPMLICSKISVRPDVPFQIALVELLQALGEQVAKFGATANEVMNATIDVTVLWDPAIHGNAGRYDVRLVDPAYRSVMVSSPLGWIVQFDPAREVEEILQDSVEYLDLDDLDMADVISLETVSTLPNVLLSSVSKPNRGADTRPPAIAGAFYPADAKKMNDELDRMLAEK